MVPEGQQTNVRPIGTTFNHTRRRAFAESALDTMRGALYVAPHFTPTMKKSAFTLIELLVVISIIAILAGIALPVYQKVLEKSHATNDANNLKQLGLGITSYLTDNDDAIFSSTPPSGGKTWPGLLQEKYVTNWKLFQSPFDRRPSGNQASPATMPVSYGVNVNILTHAPKPAWDGNWSRLASPSQLIVMAPFMDLSQTSTPTFRGTGDQAVALPEPAGGTKLGTHNGRAQINALYADGHVSTLRYGPEGAADAFTNTAGETGMNRWKPLGQ